MSASILLLCGGALGMAAGSLLVPFTRRELAASVQRAATADLGAATANPGTATLEAGHAPLRAPRAHRVALAAASGLLPAYVLSRVGGFAVALPPLLLLVGLVQLAYCDLTCRLLPKTLVYALSATVIFSAVILAGAMHEWERLLVATLGGVVLFTLLLGINLANPRWLAFGDVRLSFVVGFGLAWVSPVALLEGFLVANLLGAVIGLLLIAIRGNERRSAIPFGFYLALGTGIVLLGWSS